MSKAESAVLEVLNLLTSQDAQVGKTAVQKITYFLERLAGVDLGLRFVMYHYGPYSFELSHIIESMGGRGLIRIEPATSGFGFTLSPDPEEIDEEPDIQFSEPQRKLIEALGAEPARDLELLATTHFVTSILTNRTGADPDDEVVAREVVALKPKFTPQHVITARRKLDRLSEIANS